MGLLTNPNELTMKETYAGLIYGQPGVGKTTLALSSVNPVCIDVDRGMYRVERRYQVPSLQVEDYQQVLDLFSSGELNGFDTVVIDTLGKLIDRMGDYVIKNNPKYRQNNGTLTMQGWGQVKIEFRSLLKLIGGKNKSVIFVAHESEEKEDDVTKKRPDVSGSARKDIVKELDFMGYMEMSGNKRTISFAPSGAYYAKNSLGLDSVIEIPGIQTANSFIKDVVVSAIKRKKEQDEAQAGPYDEVIKTINNIVSAAEDIPAINEVVGKLTNLNHIWDSKIYAWSKISEAAKALGAVWDKAAKRFIVSATPAASTAAASPPAQSANEAPRPLAGASGSPSSVKPDAPVSQPNGNTDSRKTTPEPDTPPVPTMYDEPESESSAAENSADVDDGFVDDIPEPAPGKSASSKGRPSLSEEFRKGIQERAAAKAAAAATGTVESTDASGELDIF
jgi:hypothetical protein